MFIFISLSFLAWNRVLGSWRRILDHSPTTSVLESLSFSTVLLLASGLKDQYDTNKKKGDGRLLNSCMAKYGANSCPVKSSLLGVLRTPFHDILTSQTTNWPSCICEHHPVLPFVS